MTSTDTLAATITERPATIPAAAWSRSIGTPPPETGQQQSDRPYDLIDDGSYHGLPLGGIGSGAIGRSYRGEFSRWHTQVGVHRHEIAYANQFSVYVEQAGQRQAQVLWTERPTDVLQDWQWECPREGGTYYALFPRAWLDYGWDQLPIRLTQEQLSPVIPGNERESSYPVAVFEWRVENISAERVKVGLMLTWENFLGRRSERKPSWQRPRHLTDHRGNLNRARRRGKLVGVELGRAEPFSGAEWDGSIAILARETEGVTASYRSSFVVDERGADVWQDFAHDGQLDNIDPRRPNDQDRPLAAALAVTFELEPGEVKTIPFALAWDQPVVEFNRGTRWSKHYTRFFDRSGANAWRIAADALRRYPGWRRQIERWQRPILRDQKRPEWYKTALFNELYYLVDGGTLWVDGPVGREAETEQGPGLFAYLECYDYPFYATHDVAFYSSWALLLLWPNLERQEMLQFVETITQEDLEPRVTTGGHEEAVRKIAGAVPHDLGGSQEDPLLLVNAYDYQDVNAWKDLNLKYVLRAYRNYVMLDDRAQLDAIWPTIPVVLDYIRKFDIDGDGLLEHHGADQTYDAWAMEGASAYTSGLLIAALSAAAAIAELQGDQGRKADYEGWRARAQASFEAKVWNGRYYRYNTGDEKTRESIMAGQLAGQWYAGAVGLPDIGPKEHIRSALHTIFEHNVLRFGAGAMGAVNGMFPDGSLLDFSDQAQEVWSGVVYALAAAMLQEGMDEQAWQTAWGLYQVTYVTNGFWFRTPEAWYEDGRFRACMYMRPQAIWAIEHALAQRKRKRKAARGN